MEYRPGACSLYSSYCSLKRTSFVGEHCVATPWVHEDAVEQAWHGDTPSPAVPNETPATQLDLQSVSALMPHASSTPSVQVDVAAQGAHVDRPLTLQLVPLTHGTLHVVSELRVHVSRTPLDPHDAPVLHVAHGSAPVAALNVEPLTQAALHTVSVVEPHSVSAPYGHEVHVLQGLEL